MMNYFSHPVTRTMTVLGLLLATCIVSLAMQPLPTSAANKNAPRTEGVDLWSTEFNNKLSNPSFAIWPDRSSPAGEALQIKSLSANRGGQYLAAKKDGGGTVAICAYLSSVITYPYVNSAVKAYALSLYRSYGCQPAL